MLSIVGKRYSSKISKPSEPKLRRLPKMRAKAVVPCSSCTQMDRETKVAPETVPDIMAHRSSEYFHSLN